MHEQNNAETVTKMHIFSCCLPKALILFFYFYFYLFIFFVEADWLAKHIKGYLSIRFFWKFRDRVITSSGLDC